MPMTASKRSRASEDASPVDVPMAMGGVSHRGRARAWAAAPATRRIRRLLSARCWERSLDNACYGALRNVRALSQPPDRTSGLTMTQLESTPPRTVATLDEVARVAGVSRATVSRVVNGSPKVSADVRRSVEKAIDR